MNWKRFKILTISSLFLASSLYAGLPSFFPFSGTKTFSLNGIYAAGSDGISNLTTNPAGIAFLKGRSFEISIFDRLGQQDYIDENNDLYRSFRDDDIGVSLGLFWNLSENLTFAVDYNSAYQYKVSYPFALFVQGDSSTAVLAFDHYNDFSFKNINPTVGIKFGKVGIGVSANIYQVNHKLSFYRGNAGWESKVGGIAAYQVKYGLDSWGFGGTIGLQAELSEKMKFGAFIKSPVTASLEGTAESKLVSDLDSLDAKTNLSSDFELPWNFGIGILYSFNNKLHLNVDAAYYLWSGVNENQQYKFDNQTWSGRFKEVDSLSGYSGTDFPLNYDNSFNIGFGLEYITDSNLSLRFGYRFSKTQNSASTYSMLYPHVDNHWISFSVGFWFEDLYMDAGLAYSKGIEKTINEEENLFHSGKYSGDTFLPSVNIKYLF